MSTPLIPPGGGAAAAKNRAVQYSPPAVGHNAARLLVGHQHVTACELQARSDRGVSGGLLADSVVEALSTGEFFFLGCWSMS